MSTSPGPLRSHRQRRGTTRPAALLAVLALAVSGLGACGSDDADDSKDGGSGSAAVAETPGEAVESYIAAASAGDFEKAFAYVIEPGEVSPDAVARLTSEIDPAITLVSGGEEPEDDSVDSVSVDYFWGEEEFSVQVAKGGEDGWRLVEPAHLMEADLAEDQESLYVTDIPHLQAVADVAITTQAGDDISAAPQAVLLDPTFTAAGQSIVSVDLTGRNGFPSQTLEGYFDLEGDRLFTGLTKELGSLDDVPMDLGSLVEQATSLAVDNMGFRTHYVDTDTGKVVFQHQPVTALTDCLYWKRNSFGRVFDGFWFRCGAELSDTNLDGEPLLENGSALNNDGYVAPPGEKSSCTFAKVQDSSYAEEGRGIAFRVLDGELSLMWESEGEESDEYNLSLDGADVDSVKEFLQGYGADCLSDPFSDEDRPAGDEIFTFGLVPYDNAVPGYQVSAALPTT